MARIKGTWDAYKDDFIVNYNGDRRIGTVAYSDKVDKRGYVRARVWHDIDQDGIKDRGEKVIAKYKADAQSIYYELDYYSNETGDITIDDETGRFGIFYDGDLFGRGKILDMDYFFD